MNAHRPHRTCTPRPTAQRPAWALLPPDDELERLAAGTITEAEAKRHDARQQWLAETFPRLIPIGGRLVPTSTNPEPQETIR